MSAPDQVKLPRHVGLMGACGFVFGSIVGSGIFISPRGVFENAGSLGVGMLIWVAAGLLSTFGALCYVELGTMIPKSGGEFPILLESCGPLVAYLFAWTSTFMIKPAALSMHALTFAEYVLEPIYGNCGDVPLIGTKLTAAALIVFVVALNCFSTKASAKVVTLFTFGKVIGLSIIVVGGIIRLGQGYTSHFQDPFSGELPNVQQISASLFQGLWAFGGWNNLNSITEELKNPNKDMPRAIIASMVLVTGLYMLTNVAYFTVLSYDEILTTPAVGAKFGSEVMGPMSWVIPFSVACSLFGSSVGTTFTAGRIPYVAAREGLFNQVLSMIHVQRLTPTPSVLLGGALSLILLVVGDFNSLLGYFSFAYWGYLFLAVASLLYFRWKMPDRPRPVKIPLFVPITFCLGSSYLVIASMVYHPKVEYLIALACMLFGLVFYIPFVYFRVTSKVIRFTNNFFQTLLMVILPDKD